MTRTKLKPECLRSKVTTSFTTRETVSVALG